MKHTLKELTVELKPSKIVTGEVGVFAARDIRKGEKVCAYGAEAQDDFMTNEEFAALSPALQEKVCAFTAGRPGGFLMDADIDFNELPLSIYVNHSCESNLGFDAEGDFIARRDIPAGEELFYDYGLLENRPDAGFACRCGAPSCRITVTGEDWRNPEFQKRNKEYLYPDLRALVD